jgi:CRISPR-associated protein Cas2
MDLLITYDVATDTSAGRRRLRRVAKLCQAYGQRVQLSVFECQLNDTQIETFEARLIEEIDPAEDSLRIYLLPPDRAKQVRSHGKPLDFDLHDTLIL